MRIVDKSIVMTILATGLAATGAMADPLRREQVEAALPALREMAQKAVDDGQVPGLSIAVVLGDSVLFAEGFGVKEMGKPDKVDADTVFQLASMSKPISSTVVAALVSKGIVDWESQVSHIAPQFQLHDAYPSSEVTLRDLFNHRSGLPGSAGNDIEDIGFDRDTIMERLRLVPAWVSFRGGYSYSNAGLTMGGMAAANAAGKAWEDIAQDELFGPLGMATASYRYDDFAARTDRAALHVQIDGAWTAKVTRDADPQAPAGGASASVVDLASWMQLELANGKWKGYPLISEEALAATHQPLTSRGKNPVSGAPSFYGLGWNVEFGRHGETWGHAGAFSNGARTLVTLWPDTGLGVTILANAFPTGVPEGISDNFADLVFDGKIAKDHIGPWNDAFSGLFGPAIEAAKAEFAKPPADTTPALPDSAYVGRYANDYVGVVEVQATADGLTVALGPEGKTHYPLTHFDRDTFVYFAAPEMPDLPSPATFQIGTDGKANALVLDTLDANGLGKVTRLAE
ncbi:serine hydrolase [Tabrizicola sp. J26]|nr:serine hydrolase [Tabrizicola rongguiensis]